MNDYDLIEGATVISLSSENDMEIIGFKGEIYFFFDHHDGCREFIDFDALVGYCHEQVLGQMDDIEFHHPSDREKEFSSRLEEYLRQKRH